VGEVGKNDGGSAEKGGVLGFRRSMLHETVHARTGKGRLFGLTSTGPKASVRYFERERGKSMHTVGATLNTIPSVEK